MKDQRIELEKLLINICNKQKRLTDMIILKNEEKKVYTDEEISEVKKILNET